MAANNDIPKKISELSSDELDEMRIPLGVPGAPYPMAKLKKGDKGVIENDVGVIESAQNPLLVYADKKRVSPERVYGTLMRQAPIPGMMFMLRDLLVKMSPESKNRILTVFGDAAFGKSHMFKLLGTFAHPQGCISVDCGGMNMREIFFRTVIDYGKGVKEQFDERVASGKIGKTSLDALEAAFPGSVVTNDEGKTAINWEALGKPRQKDNNDGTKTTTEDRGDAAIRAKDVLTAIYEKEGINVQTNAFGIKTVPGEWFESIWSGRPLFLDEFNKSKKGTLDSFQTALQFANGEIDEVTLYNPMAQAGDGDSPKAITVKRDDLRMGWFVGVAGNDATDGDTTQELSTSMLTRLNPMYIGDPALRDWNHRVSQIWTGLPVATLYTLFKPLADSKPDEFASWLIGLRKLGLTADEQKQIPEHEIYLLQNFQETVQAVNQVSTYYNDRLQMSNPESKLFDKAEFRNLSDEISADGDKIFVSFRQAIADFNKAITAMPEVRNAAEANLTLNLAEAFKAMDFSAAGRTLPAWHKLGSRLVDAMLEDIANKTIGMPQTNAALVKLCEDDGIFPPTFKEAKPGKNMKPLTDLLKYDALKDLGGTEELMATRGVLMACLKAQYGKKLQGNDETVIPLRNLGAALKELKEQKNAPERAFVVPNDDLNSITGTPMVMGLSLPCYLLDDPSEPKSKQKYTAYEPADFRSVLAALVMPDYAKENRDHIWPVDIDGFLQAPPTDKAEIEAMTHVKGKSQIGFDLIVLAGVNSQKEPAYLYVIEDKKRDKMMVVGPEDIPAALKSELSKKGISYVIKDDPASVDLVNQFLADGAKYRGEIGQLQTGNTQFVIESLIKAFSALVELTGAEEGDDPNQMVVGKGSTLGQVIHDSKNEPSVYTQIVRPKAVTTKR